MNIIIGHHSLCIGGFATLIIRLTSHLAKLGHNVTICLYQKSEQDHLVDKNVHLIYLNKKGILRYTYLIKKKSEIKNINNICVYNCLITFTPENCLFYHLSGINALKSIYCVYYSPYKRNEPLSSKYFYKKLYPEKWMAATFMDETVREDLKRVSGIEKKGDTLPVPVTDKTKRNVSLGKEIFKIVSVGRVEVEFKTYNKLAAHITKKLIDLGVKVQWDVYGNFVNINDKKIINTEIQKNKVESELKFHGPVQYEKFESVLNDAHVFVGMGTSAIEASLYGLPVVCIPAYFNSAYCYGYWHEQEQYWCGGLKKEPPHIDAIDLLCKINNLNLKEYNELCCKDHFKSKDFLIEKISNNLLDIINSAPYKPRKINISFISYLTVKFLERIIQFIKK